MIDANNRLEALRSAAEEAIEPTEATLRELEKCLQQPLKPETLQEIGVLAARVKRRLGILQVIARALRELDGYFDTLLQDGFPALPTSDDAAAAEDLDETFARLSRSRDLIASLGKGGGAIL